MLNKDFYSNLPGTVCVLLDDLIEEYGTKYWFAQAWEEYRQHILTTEDLDDMMMPGFVFKKYIEKEGN